MLQDTHTYILYFVSNVNYRYFTRSQSLAKQMLCRRLCLKRLATKQHIFFRRNKFTRRTNLRFFLQTTAAHEKSPTLNHVVCITHMLTGYESRAWSTHNMRSRQRIIFIRYFPIFGAIFENIKNRLFYLLFFFDQIYCTYIASNAKHVQLS